MGVPGAVDVIKAVQRPLGFFVLALLVVEVLIGYLAGYPEVDKNLLGIQGTIMFLFVVSVVLVLVYKTPAHLLAKETSELIIQTPDKVTRYFDEDDFIILEKLDGEGMKMEEIPKENKFNEDFEFYYDIAEPPVTRNNTKYWNVSLSIKADDPSKLEKIEKVYYLLHPTFHNNVLEETQRVNNFEASFLSYGDFNSLAVIVLKNKDEAIKLVKYLPIGIKS